MSALRFLVLTQYFPPEIGAAQARLAAFVRELVAAGHEVDVVTAMPNYPTGRIFRGYRGRLLARERWHGAIVHRVALYPAMGKGLGRLLNYASFAITSTLALFRARRPDVVFIESPPLPLVVPGMLAARARGARSVVNVADLWPDSLVQVGALREGSVARALRRLESWAYRSATLVTAVTEGMVARLSEKGVERERILFLPNGVDAELFHPRPRDEALVRELGLEGKTVALYAGTHGFAHALSTILDAAEKLREAPIHFLFVGDGSKKGEMVESAQRRGLRNVTFLPAVPQEDLPRFYSVADVALSTLAAGAFFEGSRPVKVFSGMASALPVLYSGSGEGARLVVDAEAGVVVPPEDAGALAAALVELANDPKRREELGRHGRSYVLQHLAWPAIVSAWLAQLEARRSDLGR